MLEETPPAMAMSMQWVCDWRSVLWSKGQHKCVGTRVANQYEFSLSQMWVISGSFGDDLNTIEAGWQACSCSSDIDFSPRKESLLELVQNSMGTTILGSLLTGLLMHIKPLDATICYAQALFRPTIGLQLGLPSLQPRHTKVDNSISAYWSGRSEAWELVAGIRVGRAGGLLAVVLFTHLRNHASMVQYGGEVVNTRPSGFHTSTQMGSGHFAGEGFGKASYFRNLQVVDWDNSLIPLSNLRVLADHPSCYDIQGGINNVWGIIFTTEVRKKREMSLKGSRFKPR
ncbi:hypothetical protein CK203_018523 [Vitis vinifera]|uniref:Neprosin PEP catalytic domain-containing protein n=1 Tax=Vitis vinifera TaxID=29760 RepID=A0A438J6C7_VITVI|nr:hypothetical protein CK203_018523 [Vitis vinifera]